MPSGLQIVVAYVMGTGLLQACGEETLGLSEV